MSADLSVRKPNRSTARVADVLLRANGGMSVSLLVAPAAGDTGDGGQLGIDAPNFQELPLAPAAFRKTRAAMTGGKKPEYEMLISATAVEAQVNSLELTSADALFQTAAGIRIEGTLFEIASFSVSESLGHVYLYRLLLRESGWL